MRHRSIFLSVYTSAYVGGWLRDHQLKWRGTSRMAERERESSDEFRWDSFFGGVFSCLFLVLVLFVAHETRSIRH